MSKRLYPPEFCDLETVCYRLGNAAPEYVRQLIKRGLLPNPIKIGELQRWKWADVELAIESVTRGGGINDGGRDPYLAGLERGKTTPPLRLQKDGSR